MKMNKKFKRLISEAEKKVFVSLARNKLNDIGNRFYGVMDGFMDSCKISDLFSNIMDVNFLPFS